MSSKYDRDNLQPLITDINGLQFLDMTILAQIRYTRILQTQEVITIGPRSKMDLPKISMAYYDTTSLFWIIALYNGIVNPFTELVSGLQISIPTQSSIEDYIKAIKAAQFVSQVKLS